MMTLLLLALTWFTWVSRASLIHNTNIVIHWYIHFTRIFFAYKIRRTLIFCPQSISKKSKFFIPTLEENICPRIPKNVSLHHTIKWSSRDEKLTSFWRGVHFSSWVICSFQVLGQSHLHSYSYHQSSSIPKIENSNSLLLSLWKRPFYTFGCLCFVHFLAKSVISFQPNL